MSEVYADGTAIFQDDGASIHIAEISLGAVRDTFETRVNPTLQAPKMADIWPIENVWGIIKDKVAKKPCQNNRELRQAIINAWRGR